MIIQAVSGINFKSEIQTADIDKTNTNPRISTVESNDTFESKTVTKNKKKKKKHVFGKILLGILGTGLLIYGGVVLKRKLSKPSFEEIQRCFKEIFEKDLSKEEVESLIAKYKELCKNDKTEDFAKKLIEQLKIDYGIEKVETTTTVTRLKDGKLKTSLEQTEYGNSNPLGGINIMPPTHEKTLIRSYQEDTFETGFHELKHVKQFAEAYKADPDKFVDAIYKQSVTKDLVDKSVKELKANLKIEAKNLLNNENFKGMSLNEIEDLLEKEALKGYETYENCVAGETKKFYRQMLDARFGKLERYQEGTEEYKKGLEYIDAYAHYPDFNTNYEEYKKNLLEKEAWHVSDLAKNIYKYISSIWKL